MPKNYGFDPIQERLEQRGDEWQFGAESQPCNVQIPIGERGLFRPEGEVQRGKEDMMDCASRGPINILAEKFTYAYRKGLFLHENSRWLEDNGYVVDKRIDFSDAFVAINSGTTRTGNSLKAPLQAIHSQGLIPKAMLPLEQWMTFADYHDSKRITQKMRDLGSEFKDRFIINYEQVAREKFAAELEMDFLNVAAHAWPAALNGVYPRTADPFNHVFEIWKPKYFAFDNYIDFSNGFTKHLAPDYSFFDYGYRVYISAEGQVVKGLIQKLVALLWLQVIALQEKLATVLGTPPNPPPAPHNASPVVVLPKPAPMPPTSEKFPSLDTLCEGIRDKEGKPPHDRNYRNNNPGNCRYSSQGYLAKYGKVGEDRAGVKPGQRGFAIFRDYATGWLYMKNLIIEKIRKHPTWTLYDFIGDEKEGWAPASDDNDSYGYAEYLAKRLRVDIRTFQMEDLLV